MSDVTEDAKSASTETFITALVLNAAIFGVEIVLFTILRRSFKAIYEPRTYVPEKDKRVTPLAESLLGWPLAVIRADHDDIRRTNGMDAYFFVRFLRMMARVFLPIWLVSWAVLLPVHGAGRTNNKTGLDQFTFGNVHPAQQSRYAAHIILLYFATFWILYNIRIEMAAFLRLRQQHLVDPKHSSSAQANTVLITGVPRKFLDEAVIAQLFSHLPGGAKAVWLNRDLKEMPELHERRLKACDKLEGAEKDLMATAAKLHAKGKTPSPGEQDGGKGLGAAEKLVPADQRPMHRLPAFSWLPIGLPFISEKVDTIEWCKKEISETNQLLEESRQKLRDDVNQPGTGGEETYPPLNSAFILFNQQIAAHLAAQSLTHNEPYRMAAKYTEVAPDDVIWSNLGLNPYEQKIRLAISYAATAGLIIFWAIPVAAVGIISNVYGLCRSYSWLAWICTLPDVVVGLLQGVLPPVLLAVLMALLPIILRLLAHFEGIPRRTGLELSLMTRFFIFQVIHSFLIVTLSGGIIQALPGLLENPTSIPNLLAQNLPQASTFFLTYIILQGLTGAAGGLLQIVPLILYYVKLFLLGSTPRKIYGLKYTLRNVAWGTLFPAMTLITTISLVYWPLQPVMAGLAFATFVLLYQVWKYLFLWVLDQPASGDTGGLFFPKAIQHVFVGLYVQEICLCALFFLARNEREKPSAIAQGALMAVLIVITAGYHSIINNSYGPLLHSLPLTLAHKSYGMPKGAVEMPTSSQAEIEEDSDSPISKKDVSSPIQGVGAVSASVNRKGLPGTPAETPDLVTVEDRLAAKGKRDADAYIQARKMERGDLGPDGAGREGEGEEDTRPLDEPPKAIPTDFNHPASVEPQRPIWIPHDTLGIAEEEAASMRQLGISVSMEDAVMNEKGKVAIDGAPPEM